LGKLKDHRVGQEATRKAEPAAGPALTGAGVSLDTIGQIAAAITPLSGDIVSGGLS